MMQINLTALISSFKTTYAEGFTIDDLDKLMNVFPSLNRKVLNINFNDSTTIEGNVVFPHHIVIEHLEGILPHNPHNQH